MYLVLVKKTHNKPYANTDAPFYHYANEIQLQLRQKITLISLLRLINPSNVSNYTRCTLINYRKKITFWVKHLLTESVQISLSIV